MDNNIYYILGAIVYVKNGNVEMTLGASGCVKLVGSVDVVTGCGHWVVDTLLTT